MSTRDITNDLIPQESMLANITANTTTNGTAINVANFDGGFMFFVDTINYLDGTYVVTLEDSPDNIVWTAVAADKIIKVDSVIDITAATPAGGELKRIGAFSTEEYVRPVVVSTGVISGADIIIHVVKKGEIRPVTTIT